jgi:hypothetical protein
MDGSVALTIAQLDVDALIGLTPARAALLVKAAGGHLERVVEDGTALTFDRSPGRVRVAVESNRIVRVM